MNVQEFANIIKRRRELLGIIQPELAEAAGVSLRSLKEIETGKANPSIRQINKIMKVLGLKIEIITTYEE